MAFEYIKIESRINLHFWCVCNLNLNWKNSQENFVEMSFASVLENFDEIENQRKTLQLTFNLDCSRKIQTRDCLAQLTLSNLDSVSVT